METGASWLADGVKEIERIAKTAMIVEPKLIAIPQEKPGTYGIVTPGPAGSALKIEQKLAGPAWHNERLDDPAQLKAFITSMHEDRGVAPENGVVYISGRAIVYIYDFEDRRNHATCPLIKSPAWTWLEGKQPPMDQRTIIRLLRIVFDGSLPTDSNLVSVLRNVKWKQDGSVDANLQRGKEALGRTILNEAAGITNFPEEFTARVNVFENYRPRVAVRLALELLPDVMQFEVIPFPNQVHTGMADTLEMLREDIAATNVPTFIGAVSQ